MDDPAPQLETETPSAARQISPANPQPDDLRAVVLLIRAGKIERQITGAIPLKIDAAAAWQPSRSAIEAKYPWLCRMMGTDTLIKLALDVVAMGDPS